MKLSDYLSQLERVCERLEEAEARGDETDFQNLIEELDDLKRPLAEKVDHWIEYLDAMETRLEHLTMQEERIEKALFAMKRLQENTKAYLVGLMQQTGVTQLRGDSGVISLRQNSQARVSYDVGKQTSFPGVVTEGDLERYPHLVPYTKEMTIRVLDKDKVTAAIQDGIEVPGVHKGERGYHLRIRG